jgi:preprotein translocase subunit SecE
MQPEEKKNLTARVAGWPAATKSYVEDLQLEMRKVTWPSWKQVRATTAVVIGAVFGFSAYFYVVDLIVGRAVTRLFDSFTK